MVEATRILIVADDVVVAKDLTIMLERHGYKVVASVGNAEDAIREALAHTPELILMDIGLRSKLDGIDAAEIIRSRSDIPVVYLTSYSDEDVVDRAKRTQPLGFIAKPFSESELRNTIAIALYKHRVEKQLRESEERHRLLAENAADMISRHDPTGVFLYASPACRHIFGYEPDELVGLPACYFVHPDDVENRRSAWSRTVHGREIRTITYRVRRKTGDYVWVETTHKPILDSAAQTVCEVTAVSRDISERKKAENLLQQAYDELEKRVEERTAQLVRMNEQLIQERDSHKSTAHQLRSHEVELELQNEELRRTRQALEESRDELANLYDFAPVGYVALDPRSYVQGANLTACSMLGVDRRSLIGRPLLRFAASEQDANTLYRHCNTICNSDTAQGCEMILARADGTRFHAALRSVKVKDEPGDLAVYRTVISDITDRKEAEEARRKWAQIFQHAEWGVMVGDPEATSLTMMNPAFARMHGYEVWELTGRPITNVVAPECHDKLQEHLRSATEKGHHTFESKGIRKDGTTFPALVDITMVKDEHGRAQYHIASVQDVSTLKRVEHALRNSEERFRAFFDSARDCLFVKDRSLKYTHVNPAAATLLNRNAMEIIGQDAATIFGKEAGRHLRQLDLRVLSGQSIEHVHTLPVNSVPVTFHEVMVPLRDGEGAITGVCCISRNITDLKSVSPASVAPKGAYRSKAMCDVLEQARFAASTDATILLLGESGTGKDYLARWIHDHSRRASGEFFSINCAALPHELAESELFGHEAGAYTGAQRRKRGLLELAEGGTLLLNEIGELPLSLQSKLLAFLDTRSFVRIGGEKSIQVNARLIAATHRDLKACVADGTFLQPLFFRLNVFAIEVPPLRQRIEDIPILVEEIMSALAKEMQLTHVAAVSADVISRLCAYHWPGNVRELRNVLERALMISGTAVCADNIPLPHHTDRDWKYSVGLPLDRTLYDIREDLTVALCKEALRRSQGNRTEAARVLGISRHSLYRFMKESEHIGENQADLDE
jgi:PAS domain S-box-containing protein